MAVIHLAAGPEAVEVQAPAPVVVPVQHGQVCVAVWNAGTVRAHRQRVEVSVGLAAAPRGELRADDEQVEGITAVRHEHGLLMVRGMVGMPDDPEARSRAGLPGAVVIR